MWRPNAVQLKNVKSSNVCNYFSTSNLDGSPHEEGVGSACLQAREADFRIKTKLVSGCQTRSEARPMPTHHLKAWCTQDMAPVACRMLGFPPRGHS